MSSPFDNFKESLADATIDLIEKESDQDLAIHLTLWNEEKAVLKFKSAIYHERLNTKELEYMYESLEGHDFDELLKKSTKPDAARGEFTLFSLTDPDDKPVCQIVAKSVDFSLAS